MNEEFKNDNDILGTSPIDSFSTSDARLKTNQRILDPDHSLQIIKLLTPKSYLYNGIPSIGFIAQDVLLIDPQSVKKSTFHAPNSNSAAGIEPILSISYSDLFVHHIAAFQAHLEKQRSLDIELENRISTLTEKIENLEIQFINRFQSPFPRKRQISPQCMYELDSQNIKIN